MHTLNDDQVNCLRDITDFINKEPVKTVDGIVYKYYLLDGAGGCGKSTLISELCKYGYLNNLSYEILAPTNKSSGILQSSLKSNKIAGCYPNVKTIAKFLGYKLEIDEETGEKVITYSTECEKLFYDFMIIDECSMISKEQLKMLRKVNSKIIFIGDDCQLPPINEIHSSVYSLDFEGTSTLLKNMRTEVEDLSNFITLFRHGVYNNRLSHNYSRSENYHLRDLELFKQRMVDSFRNSEDAIVLCWTNVRCNMYNTYIRSSLFDVPEEDLDKFYAGEKLTFSGYWCGHKTSQTLIINSVNIVDKKIYYPECKCEEPNGVCDTCGIKFTHKTKFKVIKFYELTTADDKLLVVYDEKHSRGLYNILSYHKKQCLVLKNKKKWKQYYNYRDQYIVPITHSYCSTVHKAQGSGYHTVYVDMNNILLNNTLTEKLRLLYVAFSRARSNIVYYRY